MPEQQNIKQDWLGKPCPECNGSGEKSEIREWESHSCPKCAGTGEAYGPVVVAPTPLPTLEDVAKEAAKFICVHPHDLNEASRIILRHFRPHFDRLTREQDHHIAKLVRELNVRDEQIDRLTRAKNEAIARDPCAGAIDKLWRDCILAHRPNYGDWEYADQAYRHIRDEFNAIRAQSAALAREVEELRKELAAHAQ